MKFGDPSNLYSLWVLIPLLFFIAWGNRRKHELIVRFCGEKLFSKLVTPNFRKQQNSRAICTGFAILFLLLSLTRPQWGYQWEDVRQEGVDIIIALDVSSSMLAEDIKPNRLERAKRKISDLLEMLQGDRVGLVAFAGTSFVQCPLTLDYTAARIFLSAIDTDLIPVQGTALGDALRTSIKAFRSEEKKSKAIILITDGEDQTGQALEAAKEAEKAGVKVYTIGVGTRGLAPFPVRLFDGRIRIQDERVNIDEVTLTQIAETTGGKYFRATDTESLEAIYNEINQLETTEVETQQFVDYRELAVQQVRVGGVRVPSLLSVAMVLLSLRMILSLTFLRRLA